MRTSMVLAEPHRCECLKVPSAALHVVDNTFHCVFESYLRIHNSDKINKEKDFALLVNSKISRLFQPDIDLCRRLALYSIYFPVPDREIELKRESGENPELPRSGKQERTLQKKHWSSLGLGSWSK